MRFRVIINRSHKGLERLKLRDSRSEANRTASAKRNSALVDPDTLVYSCRPIFPSKTIASPDSRAIFSMSIFITSGCLADSRFECAPAPSPVHRRTLAIGMLSKGTRVGEIAGAVGLSVPTLNKYKALLELGGAVAIAKLRVHGQRPRLNDEAQNRMISTIKHSPRMHVALPGRCGPPNRCAFSPSDSSASNIPGPTSHVLCETRGLAYRLAHGEKRCGKASSKG